jgi:hypothetical protein
LVGYQGGRASKGRRGPRARKGKGMKYEFHPVANIFPLMQDDELNRLAQDIKENGLLKAVLLLDGQIIDGRNRYLACQRAGIEPRFRTLTRAPYSLVGFCFSQNFHRRHLTTSQKVVSADNALPWLREEAKQRQVSTLKRGTETPVREILPQRDSGKSTDKAGELAGVSGRTVR